MIIYVIEIVLIILMGIFLYEKKISKKMFVVFSFTLMALVLGLRGNQVGEDTQHYIDIFRMSKNIPWKIVFTSGTDVVYDTAWGSEQPVEVGYMILNKLIGIFTSNGQWLIFIVACLTCWLMAKFVYENAHEHVFMGTYIYLCESLYMNSFNAMRQVLALGIAVQAYTVLKKFNGGGYRKAVMYILIACLFHKSAIVLLILIPLWRIKKNQQALKYVLLGSILFPFSMTALFQLVSKIIPRYASYFTNNYWKSNLGGMIILWFIEIIICFFIYFKKIQRDDKETFIAVSYTVIYIALEIVGLRVTIFTRMSLYFRIFLIFLFPLFARYIKPKSRFIYRTGVLALLGALFMSYASIPARMYQFFWG